LKSEKNQDLKMVFAELKYYTKTHFVVEEEMMLAYDYPEYRAHKATHEVFLAEITQFEADMSANKSYFSKSLIAFLENWLIKHIDLVDRKALEFIEKQKANYR
jgi:hemerythrin